MTVLPIEKIQGLEPGGGGGVGRDAHYISVCKDVPVRGVLILSLSGILRQNW